MHMVSEQKKDFVNLVKKYAGTITAILSFTALLLSTITFLSSDLTVGAITLLAVGSLLLLAYNIWLIKKKRELYDQKPVQLYRWIVHSGSALLLIASWSVVGVLTSDKYAGNLFIAMGQPERAAVRLQSYVAKRKDDVAAYMQLAEAYRQLRQYSDYFNTLEELLKNKDAFDHLDPDTRIRQLGMIHYNLGSALLVEEFTEGLPSQTHRALDHLKNSLLYRNDDPALLLLLGYAEASTGGPQVTIAKVKDLFSIAKSKIDSYPTTEERLDGLTMYHWWFGKTLRILKLYDEAEKELTSALELTPAKAGRPKNYRDEILFELGQNEYDRTGDTSSANTYWQKISNEKILRTTARLNGGDLWKQGVDATNAGRHKEAAELYKKAEELLTLAIQMGDRSRQLHIQLGSLYFVHRDYRQAATTFQKLTQMWPDEKLGYYMLGRSNFLIEGKLEEADKAMSKAVEMAPSDEHAHYWLGRIALARQQFERAKTELLISLELGFYRDDLYDNLVRALVSLMEKTPVNSDEYIALLEEALRQAKEGIEATKAHKAASSTKELLQLKARITNNLAYSYVEGKKNLPLALNYINDALAEYPDEPHYLDTKAWILILMAERSSDSTAKKTQLRSAETLLQRALGQLPANDKSAKATGLFHLGYVHKLRGEHKDAQRLFMEALDLNPAYSEPKAELQ